jgi:hypothetical protein
LNFCACFSFFYSADAANLNVLALKELRLEVLSRRHTGSPAFNSGFGDGIVVTKRKKIRLVRFRIHLIKERIRMFWKWFPWKYVIRRLARSHGMLDPIHLFARFSKFSQPSEVAAPTELVRASAVFHARGLLNSRAIQSNLDWVWPYWVRRQFDPRDPAFIPRSFSLTHVNMTNRNWTAVGLPGCASYPLVDPRGLVTPFFDGWSLDCWILDNERGASLLPPRIDDVEQHYLMGEGRLAVETSLRHGSMRLFSTVELVLIEGKPVLRIHYDAQSRHSGRLVVALRPFNPEGLSFVNKLRLERNRWIIDEAGVVEFGVPPEASRMSNFRGGDVFSALDSESRDMETEGECNVGMLSAAALFNMEKGSRRLDLTVDVTRDPEYDPSDSFLPFTENWVEAMEGACRLEVPDDHFQFLFDASLRTLVLHSPLDVYAGPFYYKRFWFRDAVMILNALLTAGFHDRAERIIARFPQRQTARGYFLSQNGEWDSNGQVLWVVRRFKVLTGRNIPEKWVKSLVKGGEWLRRKRLPADSGALHQGLLPAGFSAEHLGNNDFYYWDDFWAIAGLRAAAEVIESAGARTTAAGFRQEADDLEACVEESLDRSVHIRKIDAIPASPHRRMDAGAVGSLVAGYPLQIRPPDDSRLLRTVEHLLDHCFVDRAFFQDMIHSGLNPYLSLHCAEVLLRAGSNRWQPIVERVAALASSTGQWPEAVHPQTGVGCMGDGQHVWASAEWMMMMCTMFVREEGDHLIIGQGIPAHWIKSGRMSIGPVYTSFGAVNVDILPEKGGVGVKIEACWRKKPQKVYLRIPAAAEALELEPQPRMEAEVQVHADK